MEARKHVITLTVTFRDPVTPVEARAAVRKLLKQQHTAHEWYHDYRTGVEFRFTGVAPFPPLNSPFPPLNKESA